MVEVIAEDEGGARNGGVRAEGEGDAVLIGFVGCAGEVGGRWRGVGGQACGFWLVVVDWRCNGTEVGKSFGCCPVGDYIP